MKITCGIYLYSVLTGKLLLCHATRSRNQWSIPKGLKDEGEDNLTASLRELYEETGLSEKQIDIRSVFPLPPRKYEKQNKVLESFLALSDADLAGVNLVCHTLVNNSYPEIDKYRWVDLDEFEATAHESQVKNIPEIRIMLRENLKE